jgi:Ion channel
MTMIRRATLRPVDRSEFWSGDLGLTLITITLVALIFVVMPLREYALAGRVALDVVIVTLMMFGAVSVDRSRMFTGLVVVAVVASTLAVIAGRLHPTPALQEIASALNMLTLLLYVRIVLLVLFRGGVVTWSRMQGGVCAYLLLGLAWGSAFELLEDVAPGSFRFESVPDNINRFTSRMTYFSFSTLTTIGFGDVVPVTPFARSLSTAEAITGQLFPAILVGALVAMAMASRASH